MFIKHPWISNAALAFLFAVPVAAQDGMQFNVPYLCPDGYTYVVHKCEKGPKGEMCTYQTGDESERYNTRSQVWNQMRQCKVNGTASAARATAQAPSDLQNSRWDCGSGATMTITQCQKQGGQDYCFVKIEQNGQFLVQVPKPRAEIAEKVKMCKPSSSLNPPYLTEFPLPDRVIQTMKVNTPRETVVRAMGAFYQLSEVIQTLAQHRGGGLTPDEKKMVDEYSAQALKLQQLAAKNLNGEQLTLATNPYHFSRTDPRFGFEGIPVWVAFLTPTLQAQFAQIAGGNNPAYTAKVQEERQRAMKDAQAQAQQAQADADAQNMRKDAGSVAMRKCVESGRSDMECLGEGMKVGLADLMGAGNPMKAIASEGPAGLRLSGVYSAGNFSLSFSESSTFMVCGPLDPYAVPYSVERNGQQLLVSVRVPVLQKPLAFTYTSDGKLSGPGIVEIAGQVPVGGAVAHTSTQYDAQTQTTMQTRQIDAAEASNYAGTDAVHQNGMEYSVNEPVSSTSYTPRAVTTYSVPTKTKIEKCNAGVLPATGSNVKISDAMTQLLGTQASKSANTAPGLRLAGTYAAANGLKLEFRDDSATVECGQAHTAEAYFVQRSGGQLAVKLQNGATPFTLTLQPNGSLVGSGTIDVAGRRIINSSAGDGVHNFVPINARCELGTLTAQK